MFDLTTPEWSWRFDSVEEGLSDTFVFSRKSFTKTRSGVDDLESCSGLLEGFFACLPPDLDDDRDSCDDDRIKDRSKSNQKQAIIKYYIKRFTRVG